MDIFIKWCNDNSGFVTFSIFIVTLLIGWVTGFFRNLFKKPRFVIDVIAGPSFCCNFNTGRDYKEHKSHRTAISLYLSVLNIGTAPSSIHEIQVGYHNKTFIYTFLWFWLKETAALIDFHYKMGNSETVKIYPFLRQKSYFVQYNNDTYLEIGKGTSGVVYFEQYESWGEFKPKIIHEKVKIKIRILDVFGNYHTTKKLIPYITLEKAKEFNIRFGETLESFKT